MAEAKDRIERLEALEQGDIAEAEAVRKSRVEAERSLQRAQEGRALLLHSKSRCGERRVNEHIQTGGDKIALNINKGVINAHTLQMESARSLSGGESCNEGIVSDGVMEVLQQQPYESAPQSEGLVQRRCDDTARVVCGQPQQWPVAAGTGSHQCPSAQLQVEHLILQQEVQLQKRPSKAKSKIYFKAGIWCLVFDLVSGSGVWPCTGLYHLALVYTNLAFLVVISVSGV